MATITGTSSADMLIGTIDQDVLNGLEGDDTLVGVQGADHLDGGTGTDTATYIASAQSVSINLLFNTASGGDAQGDTFVGVENISGSNFADSILADGANNMLSGNGGNDTLRGLAGNDTLIGGQGADLLEGDNGIDTADYSGSRIGVSASLTDHAGHFGDAEGDTFDTIENLTGSINADVLEGDSGINILDGGKGDDSLSGQDGDDILRGGEGADLLKGGIGFDTADYSVSSSAVSASLAEHAGHFGDAEGDTFEAIENLTGSTHDDTLGGDFNKNVLIGGQGNDSLSGFFGDDSLDGGEGNDILAGSGGKDDLTGGSGADIFVYQSVIDSGPTATTCDLIHDFQPGTDKIGLHAMDASSTSPGNDEFTFHTGSFTAAGQVRVIHDVHQINGQIFGTTFVQMNTDSSPDVDSEIHLNSLLTLTASDFVL
jgi:Ca2+-binding RTX toxin-like protein